MLDVNLSLVTFKRFDINRKTVSAIGYAGRGAEKIKDQPPGELHIPWREGLQDESSVFTLLSWRKRLSDFYGRENELAQLQEWSESSPPISVKFVRGEGGMGKTRLAAEFAQQLQEQKWAAGFVDLRKPQAFCLHQVGTLIIVDYPEENREGVAELLRDLSGLPDIGHLRVLFLTRRQIDEWETLINDCRADTLVNKQPVHVWGLPAPQAHELYNSTLENAAEYLKTTPSPLSEEALTDWLSRAPEHDRPLFTMAAAVYDALNPDDPAVKYTHREIIEALVERELTRLRNHAKNMGYQDLYVFARVLALAAFTDELSTERVRQLAQNPDLRLGFPQDVDTALELRNAGLAPDGLIAAPKPDLLTAAFVVRVLAENKVTAPELIWQALSDDPADNLERFSRQCYDAEIVLGMHDHRVSICLAEAVMGRSERCRPLEKFLIDPPIPLSCAPAAIAVNRTLLEITAEDEEKARLLNNLSYHLHYAGDNEEALQTIREAVEIYRRLAQANPDWFNPYLALSLNNLSIHLSDAGDHEEALKTIREAVDIRRRLAQANPDRFNPDLALSLNNLSNHLSYAGDHEEALKTIREAVKIRRRLAQADPDRFNSGLATNLSNLSNCLSDAGDNEEALKTIREAVEIRRRLVQINPDRFTALLADSINNLSNRLSDAGEDEEALENIREAVDIYRRLAQAMPDRFYPYISRSLGNLGDVLSRLKRSGEAIAAYKEGIDLVRPYAEAHPQSPAAKILAWLESRVENTESEA